MWDTSYRMWHFLNYNCGIHQRVEVEEECDNYIFNYLTIICENIWDNEETENERVWLIMKNIVIFWYHIFWLLLVANISNPLVYPAISNYITFLKIFFQACFYTKIRGGAAQD